MNKINFTLPVAALLVGAGLGFSLRPSQPSATDSDDTQEKRRPLQIADAGNDASIEYMREYIAELEARLGALSAEQENREQRREERRDRFNPREMMERMKKEDPARYAQITNFMADMRRSRMEDAMAKMEYFTSIDLSALGDEAQETHARLISLIDKRESLEQHLMSEDISDEERGNAMRDVFDTEREINDLNKIERGNLIAETVRELGIVGENADAAITALKEIIDATSSDFGNNRGPRGGRGPGGRGPGGRGPGGGRGRGPR